jgi:hypothetical protein
MDVCGPQASAMLLSDVELMDECSFTIEHGPLCACDTRIAVLSYFEPNAALPAPACLLQRLTLG